VETARLTARIAKLKRENERLRGLRKGKATPKRAAKKTAPPAAGALAGVTETASGEPASEPSALRAHGAPEVQPLGDPDLEAVCGPPVGTVWFATDGSVSAEKPEGIEARAVSVYNSVIIQCER
jgi:hypothetical protein